MAEHYFLYPFGINGTLAAVPNPTQVSGTVSYQSGFPIGYQLSNTAPGYLSIPRDQFNQLMFDVTGAIQQIQQTGFASFITASANGGTAFSYALGAQVWSGGVPYRSLIANNTDTPPTSNWAVVGSIQSLYYNWAADTGFTNNYAIAPNPPITSLAAGQVVQMQPAFANTGACRLNVNGTGALPIKTLQNQDPAAAMLIPSGMHQFEYNAVNNTWVLQNPALGSAAYQDAGTGAGNMLQLNGSAQIPAVSGALLTNLPAQYTATNSSSGKLVFGPITMQWGSQAVTSGNFGGNTIAFGTSFSGTPYHVNAMLNTGSLSSTYTTGVGGTPNVSSITNNGFLYQPPTETTATVRNVLWFAIGPT